VKPTETVSLAERKNLSDRESLIRDDVEMAAMFFMQFQHTHTPKLQLPL